MLYSLVCFLISICIVLLILFLLMGNDKTQIKLACIVPFIFVVCFFILFFNKNMILSLHDIKVDFFGNIGSYLGGVFGTIFAMFTTGLLIYQIYKQQIATYKKDITDKFYKHLDIHMHDLFALNVMSVFAGKENERSRGRRAFVVFRIQISRLLYYLSKKKTRKIWRNISPGIQISVIYTIFYYGYESKWKKDYNKHFKCLIDSKSKNLILDMLERSIEKYDKASKLITLKKESKIRSTRITRTNLTSISSYFENMFYAINLVDKSDYFKEKEKRNLVDMFICQLSEPEKFVFFFYLVSSFGEKWEKEDLLKYNLLSGLTKHYCFGYDPNILLRQGITNREYPITNE